MELLAPGGNLSCALAAFDAGADAVYCGLKQFNARERTENFTHEDLSKLLCYAHKHGRKVYVTFNTLIREDELEKVFQELSVLDQLRPDALIVQDLGVVRMVREYFPNLILHGSTQMGLHNSAGLRMARSLGLTRVILERQTTLAELHEMLKRNPGIEVELFIHGALCCCISGSCLLSSWLGGWSGNRGKCKQPCRRRYRSAEGNGFFLSAQDLCMIESIPELMASGVSSFKIEGRLRRSDYVEHVVTAYRGAMDAAVKGNFREELPRLKEELSRTYGRRWSSGFYTPQSAQTLIKHDAMGVSGLLAGRVISRSENGFTASVSRPLFIGDMLRIQPKSGDEGPSLAVTKMSLHGKNVTMAPRNSEVFIHADKEIPGDGLIYKTSERVKDYSARIVEMPLSKPYLNFEVEFSRTLCRVHGGGAVWEKTLDLAPAEKRALMPEIVRVEFQHVETSRFSAGTIQVKITENPFCPASVLKSLRKECTEFFSDAEIVFEKTDRHLSLRKGNPVKAPCADTAVIPRGEHFHLPRNCRIAREIPDQPAPNEELLLPFYSSERELPKLKQSIEEFIKRGGHAIRITSLCHLELLKGYANLEIRSCMPLHVCNSLAAELLAEQGVIQVQGSPELGEKELSLLAKNSSLPLEVYRYGRPVLLSTRAVIPAKDRMRDSKGDGFRLVKHGILIQVLPERVMSVPLPDGCSCSFYDYRESEPDEEHPARFNYDISLA